MRRERTDSERLTDNAVLLSLWALAQTHLGGDAVGDRLKLMKLAFLTVYPLYWDKIKALNLGFLLHVGTIYRPSHRQLARPGGARSAAGR